jgi:hypothetical protein
MSRPLAIALVCLLLLPGSWLAATTARAEDEPAKSQEAEREVLDLSPQETPKFSPRYLPPPY